MDFALIVLLGSIMLALTLIGAILVAAGVRWYLDEHQKKNDKAYKFRQAPKQTVKPRHIEWSDEDEFEADFDHLFEQFQNNYVCRECKSIEKNRSIVGIGNSIGYLDEQEFEVLNGS